MVRDWQTSILILSFIYLTVEFILVKGFGKKAFLLSFFYWLRKLFIANIEIKTMLENQNKEVYAQKELMYSILVKLEKVENEVTFNGGKITLVDGLKEVLYNQAIYSSEREAAMYIDPQPMFKTDLSGRLIFVNAAWLDMIGCGDEEEVMGFGYLVAVPDENKDLVEKTSRRFSESPAPFHGDFTYQHLKTKQLIYTNVRTQLIKDGKGNFIGTIGTVKILN